MLGYALVIAITTLSAFIVAVAQYIFKRSLGGFKFNTKGIFGVLSNKGVLLGIFIYFVSLGIYLTALSSGELSVVYPIFASSFIFVLIISAALLGEKINAFRITGVLLIVLGIALVASTM